MSGPSTTTSVLPLVSTAALVAFLAACTSDDEPQIETIDPNNLETEAPEQEETLVGDPEAEGDGVCALLSPDDIEAVTGEPVSAGASAGESSEIESCMWSHPEADHRGAHVLSISSGELPGEDLFDSITSGEPTDVTNTDEAVFDPESQSLWLRSGETVLQLYLNGVESSEEEFVELAEIMVDNL